MSAKYVILGGGMVAGYAAKQLAEGGLKPGELTIISSDTALPYERPPLSKSFLAGKDSEESILINPAEFYSGHGIDVRLNCPVAMLDSAHNRLHFRSGESVEFEKLIIATGARVRTLPSEGEVHYLRSMDDSKKIRDRAAGAKRAVVIGGGFIAMEVSSVLAQKGAETTMVLAEERVWQRLFTPAMSRFFESYYAERGVHFATKAKVRAIDNGSVELESGERIGCDLVVAGLGVVPVTEAVTNAGLEIADGVAVNEYLETARPGVYAAGDVASYHDVLFDKRRRVEHWDNAVSQGQHCARALLGDRAPFVHVPYFFSDIFDLSYEFWGDESGADQVVERGDIATKSFSVWWLRDGRLVAAFVMNRPDQEREVAPRWIESKRIIPPGALHRDTLPVG